ncbi:hypothetical protein [Streptomyces sp. NPDC088348]|uniref:hypothetical protein n=1 Tax=Streptomyces sp. NPDC088348 TaxID=3365853 RepID=UPI00382E19C7
MPTAVAVTSGDLVLPPSDRHTPLAAVLQPPAAQSFEASITELHALLEQHGYVIVLYAAALPAPYVQRLHAVRSVLESDRIALLPVDLPPLGVAVLARQLRQLSVCDFSPGVLASAARLLAHYIYAGALLPTVTRLDHVPVSLTTHARSWMPGSQFAVLASPAPQLAKVTGTEPGLLDGPSFGTRMLVARGQLQSDWVTTVLAPAWQVQGHLETALPADSAGWWATPRLVEFAAAIPELSVLHQLVNSVRRELCRWCGLELIGDRCGFCSAPFADPPARLDPHAQLERLPAQ